jgi:EmrB/QacA subfamily drug resistance transporter
MATMATEPSGLVRGRNVHPGLALLVIAGAQLMIVLDATIVNIALPHIQTALSFTPTSLTWVLNAYTLAFGGFLLLGGRAGDILGRRRMFVVGIAIFAGASLAGGFATTQWWLLLSRVVQGIGGAIASPTALSLITTTFEQGEARNRAFGVYAAVSGAGAAVGLILGGVLTSTLSWRWVLFVNVPIGVVLALAAPYVLNESKGKQGGRFDVAGALTSTLGISALVYGFIHAASDGWGDSVTVMAFLAAVVLLALFIVIESRSEDPLMPLRLFADRNRSGSYAVMLLTAAALFAMFFFLTQFVQEVLGYSALKAGFAFLPVSAVIVVVAQVASRLLTKVGPRWLIVAGMVLATVGMAWFATLTPTSTYVGTLLPAMLVMAAGLAFVFVPITVTAVAGVPQADAGVASAMLNVSQQIGGTLGLSILITVFATAYKNYLVGHAADLAAAPPGSPAAHAIQIAALSRGWARGFLAAAGLTVVGLIVAAMTIRAEPADQVEPLPAGL